jgi:recombination protein RecA
MSDKKANGTTATTKKKGGGEVSNAALSLTKTITDIQKMIGLKPFDSPDTTIPHVSTGSSTIDMLIGGSLARDGKSALCPGFPRRRITEVYGPESSGKTTLALSAIAKLQKTGGSALFLDFEHHLSKKYACDIGVDWDAPTFKSVQPRTFEEGIKAIMFAIGHGVDLVVVDSVAAMVPEDEMEKKSDAVMKLGAVAALMAKMLPRIGIFLDEFPRQEKKKIEGHPGTAIVLLNQTRALISTGGGGHGDGENTSGGKALKFFSSLRIRMSRIKTERIKRKDRMSGREITVPYGNLTYVKIVKSKLDGTQDHTSTVFIRYGYGVDDYFSIIEAGVTQKLVRRDGAWFVFEGERFQGRDKLRKYFIANPKAFEELKAKILAIVVAGSKAIDPDEDLSDDDNLLETMNKFGSGEGDDGEDEEEETAIGAVPEEIIEDADVPPEIDAETK